MYGYDNRLTYLRIYLLASCQYYLHIELLTRGAAIRTRHANVTSKINAKSGLAVRLLVNKLT